MTDLLQVVKHTKENFSIEIENRVRLTKCSYLEALVFLVEEKDIEFENASKLLTSDIKSHIEAEAYNLNLLKIDKNKLPL